VLRPVKNALSMQRCEKSLKCAHTAENGQPVGNIGNIKLVLHITKKWTFHKYLKDIVFIKNHK